MSIQYAVAGRASRPFTRWGLTLPPPCPIGDLPPVYLPGGGNGLAEAMMGETVVGYGNPNSVMDLRLEKRGSYRGDPLPPTARGIWTAGISDCMVVCGAYYNAAQQIWGQAWFHHVEGGQYEKIVRSIETDLDEPTECPNANHRYAVIAAGNDIGVKFIAADLNSAGIPLNNITIYNSGTGNRGFAFGVNFSTGLFGEVAGNGMELPTTWQW